MQELKINKTFNTREELEKYEKELCDKYIVAMVVQMPQQVGKEEIYGIESILHFGERI